MKKRRRIGGARITEHGPDGARVRVNQAKMASTAARGSRPAPVSSSDLSPSPGVLPSLSLPMSPVPSAEFEHNPNFEFDEESSELLMNDDQELIPLDADAAVAAFERLLVSGGQCCELTGSPERRQFVLREPRHEGAGFVWVTAVEVGSVNAIYCHSCGLDHHGYGASLCGEDSLVLQDATFIAKAPQGDCCHARFVKKYLLPNTFNVPTQPGYDDDGLPHPVLELGALVLARVAKVEYTAVGVSASEWDGDWSVVGVSDGARHLHCLDPACMRGKRKGCRHVNALRDLLGISHSLPAEVDNVPAPLASSRTSTRLNKDGKLASLCVSVTAIPQDITAVSECSRALLQCSSSRQTPDLGEDTRPYSALDSLKTPLKSKEKSELDFQGSKRP